MNIPADSRLRLLRSLVELARELPPSALNALITALESGGGSQNLGRFAATPAMRERLRRLEDLVGKHPEIDGWAIGLALGVAREMATEVAAENQTEIAWTGPVTEAVSVRRVDQVIYDLLDTAEQEVLLVTFAAYKAEKALKALRDATDRGVCVKLVIELEKESGGKIAFDGLQAFRAAVPAAQVYYWPLDRRMPSASASYGSMHAKCLVADKARAIVSSANLTDYALQANMELGLVVGSRLASRLAEHFGQLIVRGELVMVT